MRSLFLYFLTTCSLGTLASWVALRGGRNPFPNVAQAVALILAGLFFQQTFFTVGNLFVPAPIDPSSALAQWSELVLFGVPVVLGFWHTGVSRKDFAGWFPDVSVPIAGYSIFVGFGLLGLSFLLTGILQNVGLPTLPHSEPGLSGVVLAPVLEEAFFRGLVLRGLLNSKSKVQAIAISSLLFALAHGDVARIPALTASGIAYAVVAIESGTLLYPILVHFGRNVAVYLFGMVDSTTARLNHAYEINQLIAGSLVLLGVVALLRLRGHFRRPTVREAVVIDTIL